MKRVLLIWLFASLTSCSFVLAQMAPEDELYGYVLAIEGQTHSGRCEFIKNQLHKMGVGYFTAPFTKVFAKRGDTITGENIVARLGKGDKKLVLGAHYDAFPGSPGANDNGSGVAVALTLLNHLLDTEWNYAIDFCFFDQEEAGLIGSSSYAQQFLIRNKHLAMINLDVEGTGEEVFVGPVGNYSQFLLPFIREAGRRTGLTVVERSEFPSSDNDVFGKLQLENIAISIVPKGDGDRLSNFVHNGFKSDSADFPRVLAVMHTGDDRSILVSPKSLSASYNFVKTVLLLLNNARR